MEQADRWVSPTIDGVPYLEKPPLLHWTARILRTALPARGGEGGLRLPAALFGFAAALSAVWFGRRLGRERAGWMAAFMCVTAAQYMEYSRVVLTDTCVAACVAACLVLFWKTWTRPDRRALHWLPFLLAAAATFYAKGFVGPALVWAGCGLFLLWKRQWRLVFALPLAYLLLAPPAMRIAGPGPASLFAPYLAAARDDRAGPALARWAAAWGVKDLSAYAAVPPALDGLRADLRALLERDARAVREAEAAVLADYRAALRSARGRAQDAGDFAETSRLDAELRRFDREGSLPPEPFALGDGPDSAAFGANGSGDTTKA